MKKPLTPTKHNAADNPHCVACGAAEIVDTSNPAYPFICLACGSWGPAANEVEHDPDDIPPRNLN
jgi:hypothetical protein